MTNCFSITTVGFTHTGQFIDREGLTKACYWLNYGKCSVTFKCPFIAEICQCNITSITPVSRIKTIALKRFDEICKQMHSSNSFILHYNLLRQIFFGWWHIILINKCLTCPFEVMGNSVHVTTTEENKTSICCLAPKSSSFPFDVFSGVLLLSRRIHNCAITTFLLSVPPVKLFLTLSVIPVPWSPVRCQQVPVMSGCLHILSLNWNTTYFSPVTTMSCLHFPSLKLSTVLSFFKLPSTF